MKAVKKKKSTVTKAPAKSAGKQIDPLYVIFEQHLFNFADPDSDRKSFITAVVNDYLTYLRKNNVIVPKSLEQPIYEELGAQVNTMLVKKIYGCLKASDYQDTIHVGMKRPRARYKRAATEAKKALIEKKSG